MGSGAGSSRRARTPRPARASPASSLMATLPGVPLYRAYGFEPVEEVLVTMPDGVTLESMTMEKPVTRRG